MVGVVVGELSLEIALKSLETVNFENILDSMSRAKAQCMVAYYCLGPNMVTQTKSMWVLFCFHCKLLFYTISIYKRQFNNGVLLLSGRMPTF